MAQGWRLGPGHQWRIGLARGRRADDRYIHCPSAPAQCLHCGKQRTTDGPVRDGLTSKIYAVVDTRGAYPARAEHWRGARHSSCPHLLSGLKSQAMLLADRGFDADWIRALVSQHGDWANIPPRRNRTEPICFSRPFYRARNLGERFFNKTKQCRLVATRDDKVAANYLTFIQLASIRLWLLPNEAAP